jgi:hypothetical protein
MTQEIILKHEFHEFIPDELERGTVYISIRFATASHLCVCGCGNKVVTPIRPTDWTLLFDGKTVSLEPSIGNWSFPCHSHYYIRKNRVKWAPQWSRERIEQGRRYNGLAKDDYFGAESTAVGNAAQEGSGQIQESTPDHGFWQSLNKWFS